MNPKISVIVPVYKAEKYLHRCVDSILAQTFIDFEVLLIDDGSPDRSGEICDEYAVKDPRVRVFHKENGGVSSARQSGIDNAQGEYTIHADPDDWVEPNMLEELYAKAKEDDADMVICDYYVNNVERQIYEKQEPSGLGHETVLCELFQQLHGSCCNKLVKRACYIKYNVQFDIELSFCEDLYFHACLLKNNIKISYLSEAFYHYDQIINSNSIVGHYTKETYDYDKMLFERFSDLLYNTSAFILCKSSIAYMLLSRAFLSGIFDSIQFREKCGIYEKYIISYQLKFNRRYLLLYFIKLSCLGNYRLLYRIFILLDKIRSKL